MLHEERYCKIFQRANGEAERRVFRGLVADYKEVAQKLEAAPWLHTDLEQDIRCLNRRSTLLLCTCGKDLADATRSGGGGGGVHHCL